MIQKKTSSLVKSNSNSKYNDNENQSEPTVMKRVSLRNDTFKVISKYSTRNEASMYLANIPRVWMSKGLMIIPSMNEKNTRGVYEMDIFASEEVRLKVIDEKNVKSLAGNIHI